MAPARRTHVTEDDELEAGEEEGASAPPPLDVPAASDEVDPLDAFMANMASEQKQAAHGRSSSEHEAGEEIDPLDAFMAGVAREQQRTTEPREGAAPRSSRCHRSFDDDDADDDHVASFIEARERQRSAAAELGSEQDAEDPRAVPVLRPVDHAAIEYEPFQRHFWAPAPPLALQDEHTTAARRRELLLTVHGFDVPPPVRSFAECGCFDEALLSALRGRGFAEPTAVQAQVIPVALAGRDLIGIAQTGSGKTAAFLLPLLVHAEARRAPSAEDGPVALVLAPTRELAEQIFVEARRLAKPRGVHCAALFGGVGKYEQLRDARAGAHVLVATPGRLLDVLKKRSIGVRRVSIAVIDEADRMFQLGFEPQLRSVLGQLRPDRQTLLFSATFRPRLEQLARSALGAQPVRVVVGAAGDASADVSQVVEVLASDEDKWAWLAPRLAHFCAAGAVILFASTRVACEQLCSAVNSLRLTRPAKPGQGEGGACSTGSTGRQGPHVRAESLHGDKPQPERLALVRAFKRAEFDVLVATDVAARGLDIEGVRTVVNFDAARDISAHTHRIGRTGRAGVEGVAYTLVTHAQPDFARDLAANLRSAQQVPPPELLELAARARQQQPQPWRGSARGRGPRGGARGMSGQARPGLGAWAPGTDCRSTPAGASVLGGAFCRSSTAYGTEQTASAVPPAGRGSPQPSSGGTGTVPPLPPRQMAAEHVTSGGDANSPPPAKRSRWGPQR